MFKLKFKLNLFIFQFDGAEKLKVSVRTVAHILFQFSSK